MYDLIMAFNEARVEDPAGGQCQDVKPFMMTDGGYEAFSDYAHSVGLGHQWKAWSADESCPQAHLSDDMMTGQTMTPLCEISEDVLGIVPTAEPEDSDDSQSDPGSDHEVDLDIVEDTAQTGCNAGGPTHPKNQGLPWLITALCLMTLARVRATKQS